MTLQKQLESHHVFPCEFMFKALGENSMEFVTRVTQALPPALGRTCEVRVETRTSSLGNHVAITLHVFVESSHEVLRIYEALHATEGVRYVL